MMLAAPTYRYGRGLVNNHDVIVFVDDLDGLGCDGRFVTVHRVTNDIIVLDDSVHGGNLPIDWETEEREKH